MSRSLALLIVLFLAVGITAASLGARPGTPPDRPDRARAAPGQRATAALLFGEALDLNAATAQDLAALPGIGPSRSERIVAARTARGGRFSSVDDLLDVPGIGPKTLARIRPSLFVSDP